jgi:nucleoside-diphosphate-sugar epimerase
VKALVIGGTGPTGPYVIEGLIERGYEISILHRGVHEIDLPTQVQHIHCDPNFAETLEQALSGCTYDLAIVMYGKLRLAAQVLGGKVNRLISVGGITVYKGFMDWNPNLSMVIPTPESAPLHDTPDANKISFRMVQAEWTVMEGHQGGYYQATHFRYPRIYGPRQPIPLEWSIIRRILDGRRQLILPEGGLSITSRGFAKNMAHALLLAVDKPQESSGQIYNIRDETLLTLRDWVNIISRKMNHQFEFVEMPYFLAYPAWPYANYFQHRVVDLSKIQRSLGYSDLVPTVKAIESTVSWYLENRPTIGSDIEKQLEDHFDYAAEDRLIRKFVEASNQIKELVPPRSDKRSYAGPKQSTKTGFKS